MPKLCAMLGMGWVLVSWLCASCLAEPLLRVGEPAVEAQFLTATGDGNFQFLVADKPIEVAASELVRWSNPQGDLPKREIHFKDGSRLALAESWTGQQSWQLGATEFSATTKLFGKITAPRDRLQAICLNLPTDPLLRSKFLTELQKSRKTLDRLYLTNGDLLSGRFVGLVAKEKRHLIEFQVGSTDRQLGLLPARVAAIVFADGEQDHGEAQFIVGMRDGSQLRCRAIVAGESQLRMTLGSGLELVGSDGRDLTYLRSLVAECRYVSDLAVADYRHVPYLEIAGPYRLDKNVLAGPLRVLGRRYLKGIGMMTASRLSFRLDGGELKNRYSRFAAALAVDDEASGGGSVIFRVYLQREGKWQVAYTSPVVRGGDAPLPMMVELGDATGLMLVTDFADRGDERDYADWLDARLE